METLQNRNISEPERWISVVGGAALAAYGLSRRSIQGAVFAAAGGALLWRGARGSCPVYGLFGISTAAERQDRQVSVPYERGIRVDESVTVNATPEELYALWRKFENLPRFMSHLESVEVHDARHSRWCVKGPLGVDGQWEAAIINEIPNALIGWRSVDSSRVRNAGSVHFKPAFGGRSTEMKVELLYDPPAGQLGAWVARVFGEDPARQVREDLRAFKQRMETGEIARAEATA